MSITNETVLAWISEAHRDSCVFPNTSKRIIELGNELLATRHELNALRKDMGDMARELQDIAAGLTKLKGLL